MRQAAWQQHTAPTTTAAGQPYVHDAEALPANVVHQEAACRQAGDGGLREGHEI